MAHTVSVMLGYALGYDLRAAAAQEALGVAHRPGGDDAKLATEDLVLLHSEVHFKLVHDMFLISMSLLSTPFASVACPQVDSGPASQ